MHDCLNIEWSDDEENIRLPENFLVLNVSGMKYETLKSTLQRFPDTLLGDEKKRLKYYKASKQAFFFKRNIQSFEAILYYYQSNGILARPVSVPMNLFIEDIEFFQLGKDVLQKLYTEEGILGENSSNEGEYVEGNETIRHRIWQLFEFPNSNRAATIVSAWSIFVIVLSITVFCLETLPVFKNQVHSQHSGSIQKSNTTRDDDLNFQQGRVQPWFSLELSCIAWFSIEYSLRLLSSPSKWKFLTSFLNMIDFLAIVPYFITLAINSNRGGETTPLSILRVVRLVRVFRIFKLSRHSMSLQILGNTLRASIRELGMLVFFLWLGVLGFSSAMYYAELGSSDAFHSIPDAFWYSLVTMTTVGYGDKTPNTLVGKIIGSLCAITGVLALALPVPVIVSNFEFFYKQNRMMHKKKQ